MCDHCGCRSFPVIERLSDEHHQILETSGALRRAIDADDHDAAHRLLVDLRGLLGPHVTSEEAGLFTELRAEESVRDTVEQLCHEHADLATALRSPPGSPPDWTPVLAGLQQLRDHIDKEEYGVFPAAVVLLSMPAWERIDGLG